MHTIEIRNPRPARRRPVLRLMLGLVALAALVTAALLLMPSAHAGTLPGPRAAAAAKAATRGASTATTPAPVDAPATLPPAPGEGSLNLNSASEDELTMLPGVGP